MTHFKREHDIDKQKWIDIIETVGHTLYKEGDLTEVERYVVLDILEDATALFYELKSESQAIIDRKSHLDATHIGNEFNPSFYVCLDGQDFCYSRRDRKWIPCQWPGTILDTFTRIKIEKNNVNDH